MWPNHVWQSLLPLALPPLRHSAPAHLVSVASHPSHILSLLFLLVILPEYLSGSSILLVLLGLFGVALTTVAAAFLLWVLLQSRT